LLSFSGRQGSKGSEFSLTGGLTDGERNRQGHGGRSAAAVAATAFSALPHVSQERASFRRPSPPESHLAGDTCISIGIIDPSKPDSFAEYVEFVFYSEIERLETEQSIAPASG
jgi:hypothetical protein